MLSGLFNLWFKGANKNQMKSEPKQKKTKYENIEEAKYTEIKPEEEKEKLNDNDN